MIKKNKKFTFDTALPNLDQIIKTFLSYTKLHTQSGQSSMQKKTMSIFIKRLVMISDIGNLKQGYKKTDKLEKLKNNLFFFVFRIFQKLHADLHLIF